MNSLNRYEKYRDKSVQLTLTSIIIISHTHAPLQLCIVTPNHNDTYGEHNNGATIQSCRGAWMWLIFILVTVNCTDLSLYFLHLFSEFIQLVPILFTPVQLCTFKNFFFIKLCLVSVLFLLFPVLIFYYNCLQFLYSMLCTHGTKMVFVKH